MSLNKNNNKRKMSHMELRSRKMPTDDQSKSVEGVMADQGLHELVPTTTGVMFTSSSILNVGSPTHTVVSVDAPNQIENTVLTTYGGSPIDTVTTVTTVGDVPHNTSYHQQAIGFSPLHSSVQLPVPQMIDSSRNKQADTQVSSASVNMCPRIASNEAHLITQGNQMMRHRIEAGDAPNHSVNGSVVTQSQTLGSVHQQLGSQSVVDVDAISRQVALNVGQAIQGVMENVVALVTDLRSNETKNPKPQLVNSQISDTADVMRTQRGEFNRNSSHQRRQMRCQSHDLVSMSDDDDQNDDDHNDGNSTFLTNDFDKEYHHKGQSVRLPPFTGKESWPVWYNRFIDVADRHRWSENTKLNELLPRLQGQAGEYVFGQLPRGTRRNFGSLIKELGNRFRLVETARAYQSKFSNRDQKSGEKVEDYAAELKRLYDKAHKERDERTRREDLLRRFLDGLHCDEARFHVEYIKEPYDIDEAVYEVVSFYAMRKSTNNNENGTGKKGRHSTRTLKDVDNDENESDVEENHCHERAARAPGRPKGSGNNSLSKGSQPAQGTSENNGESPHVDRNKDSDMSEMKKLMENVVKSNTEMQNRLVQLEEKCMSRASVPQQQERNFQSGRQSGTFQRQKRNFQSGQQSGTFQRQKETTKGDQVANTRKCYRCGQIDHFIRECPFPVVMEQWQVATQPGGFPYTQSNQTQKFHGGVSSEVVSDTPNGVSFTTQLN